MQDRLKMLLSFVGYAMRVAPTLAPEIRRLVEEFGRVKGIPRDELLPALDPDGIDRRMADIDAEVDAEIAKLYPNDAG